MSLAALIERFSEASRPRTASQYRRRRTFLLLHLGLLLTFLPIGGVLHFFGDGSTTPLRLFWGQAFIVAAIPLFLRFSIPMAKLALFSVLWVDFLIFTTAYNYGGVSAPILAAIILVPVAAFVHLRRTGRVLALAGLALGVAVLVYLEATHHQFPDHLSNTGERFLSAVTLLALACFAGVMGLIALSDQKSHRRRVREVLHGKATDYRAANEGRRSAEALARRKTAYLAAFRNDLGAPIKSMIGFSQIISRDILDQGTPDSYRGYAQDIESSGRKLLQVVHAIEDLARYEAGNLEFAIEGVDLRQIVQDVTGQLEQLASSRDIAVSSEFRTDNVFIAGDAQRLTQMVHHIIANAVQHEVFGGGVEIVLGDCDLDFVALRVSNGGATIPADQMSRLHTLFSSETTDTALEPGQGVGMPLVATLLRLHQGEIEIESAEETGTVIAIKLPRVSDDEAADSGSDTTSSFT